MKAIDETYSSNLELVYQQFEDNCMNSPTLISVAGKGSIFFSNGGDNVRNDPFLSVKTTLNAGRIAGFWNDFNVWYEYLAPKFYTTYNRKDDYRDEWNMNAHAIGAGGKIPISVKPDFKHGINLELGYFWMRGNITNIPLGSVDWNGINFNFEYFAGVPNCRYPFELFLDFSIYHNFSKNLRFYTAVPHFEDVNIGKTHMAISIGVRYNLLTTPFVK